MTTATSSAYDLAHLQHLGSLVIIIGLGDGAILRQMAEHSQLRYKDVEVLALPGEAVLEGLPLQPRWRVSYAPDWSTCERWVIDAFGHHEHVVRLASADIIDDHPLAEGPATFRREHLAHLRQLIADRSWGLGNDVNDTFMGLWHAALNAPTILPCPSLGQLAGGFGGIPAIAVGAGPSVAEHIERLRELQDRCVIVACDSVYHRLLDAGVVAHFCTPLERLKQQTQFVERARGTRTIFAGIAACHPTTVECFEGRAVYLHAADKLYDWLAPDERLRCVTGSSTGVLSVLVAASLTRGPVYLLGHDLCFEEGGSTHWEADGVAAKAWKTEQGNAGGFGANGYEERWIPGNDGKAKRSIMWWQHFGHEIATQIACAGARIYNVNAATGRYAKIENTLPGALPDPASLVPMPDFRMQADHPTRLATWRERAARLADDAQALITAMKGLSGRIGTMLAGPVHQWDLAAIMADCKPDLGVSAGNAAAFQYFLRSAIFNEQSYASWHARRHRSVQQAQFHTMRVIDGLTDAIINATEHCLPLLQKISDDCRRP